MGKGNMAYNVPFSALSVFLFPVAPFAVLSWLPQKYSASISFIVYDLQNKKYLINTTRNIRISDKSELYQVLYENYFSVRRNIK
jgi:hypothetical protein